MRVNNNFKGIMLLINIFVLVSVYFLISKEYINGERACNIMVQYFSGYFTCIELGERTIIKSSIYELSFLFTYWLMMKLFIEIYENLQNICKFSKLWAYD
jgi:hypothetical protein